jgi:hypothetical protein
LNKDGSDYQVLHHFTGGLDGRRPGNPPILVGSRLFGAVPGAGSDGGGLIYSLNPDGSDYRVVYDFDGTIGASPSALLLVGDLLYGQNSGAGNNDSLRWGAIYSIELDGTDARALHAFEILHDGGLSHENLVTDGHRLYGVSFSAGPRGRGTAFALNLDGSEFELLHAFAGQPDGDALAAPMFLLGDTLYGVTLFGGEFDHGAVFAITVPEPASLPLLLGVLLLTLCGLSIASFNAKGMNDETTTTQFVERAGDT